jgi:N-acylneuraminate cytidylyltransferase|tara:strand:+ start:204 stop:587 length:384 start_codon:yes stop_codon:yes gene_type:complete
MKIAIIPARSRSKRIKNKNIKNFHGKPIISYAIKCVKDSKLFDKILVSSDSKKIIKIAKKYGAEAPFVRPSYISRDSSLTIDVIKHAIKWLIKNGNKINFVCCVYPTSPLMVPQDLRNSFKIIKKKN